jgi:phage tail-like protein
MDTDAPWPLAQLGRFLIEAGGRAVACFQEASGLAVEHEVQEVVEGGENGAVHKLPGRRKYPNLTLKRGLGLDPSFAAWRPRLAGGKLVVERKSVAIVLVGHGGETLRRWEVAGAWPAKWTGPDPKAGSMEVAVETLELAHAGWSEVFP